MNGTDDKYMLIDDLAHDFDSALTYFRTGSYTGRWAELERQLGNTAFVCIVELESLLTSYTHGIDNHGPSTLDKPALQDLKWIQVRSKAAQTLECMEFDLERWERRCGL